MNNNYPDWSDFDNVTVFEPLPHMFVAAAMPNLRRIVTFNYEPDRKLGLRLIVQCYTDGTYDYQLIDGTKTMDDEAASELFYSTLAICNEDGYAGI